MFIEGENQNFEASADESAVEGSENEEATASEGADEGAKPTLESLQQSLRETQEQLQASQMRMLDPEYQEYLADRRAGGKKEPQPKAPAKPMDPLEGLSEEEVNAMSNKQLIHTAVTRAVESISSKLRDDLLPEIEQRLSSMGDTVADQAAKREVAEAASKYQDFWTYQKQMVALSVQPKYDGLGAEDLYLLAKAAKDGGKQPKGPVSKPTPGQRISAKAGTEKPGTGTGGDPKGKTEEMSAEEAGNAAWEKVFGKK